MSFRTPRAGLTLAALLATASPVWAADVVQTISTNQLNYGTFGSQSDSLGPYPWSNFGVQASASLATDFSVGVQGSTQFALPTINPGDVFHANTSSLDYAYTANWTQASVGSHTGLSASASFNYDLGPFSGSKSIYDQALNVQSNGNLGTGATLTGGISSDMASGSKYGVSYGLSAFVASASVGLNAGLDLKNDLTFTPTVQYGYYTWVNKTGLLSGSDTLTWVGVQSGDLSYQFPTNLDVVAGSNDFYLNFMPAVRMDLTLDGSATVTVPLDGNFNAEAFGDTLIDLNLPLGNLYSDTETYDTWNDDVEWNNGQYTSIKLHQDNIDCQIHPGPSCATYTVLQPLQLLSQSLIPQDNGQGFMGGATGGFDPGLSNAPKVPQICNPATGQCWNSDDPNAPIGPGTVTFQVTTGVPEPAGWALMIAGLGGLGLALRRRREARTPVRGAALA